MDEFILNRQIEAIATAVRFIRDRQPVGGNAVIDMHVEELEAASDALGNLAADLADLKDRLSKATQFRITDGESIVYIESRGNAIWAVTDGCFVYGKDGSQEYEPHPSNRTCEFIENYRFTIDEAWRIAHSLVASSRKGK